MTAPVTDRPTHATTALVRQILEAHPEGLTDDQIWKLTGLGHQHHGSVVRRRKDTGAVPVGKGKSRLKRSCTVWALPGAQS
jgi:hypothetical protein